MDDMYDLLYYFTLFMFLLFYVLLIYLCIAYFYFFFFQAEDGIRDIGVTGVQTCALPILELIAKAGGALAATSANRSGHPPALDADDVERQLGAAIDLLLDGGVAPGGVDRKSVV